MIPKIIHYCWMSGEPFPDLIKDCIESWKNLLPDYKIVEWNKENFDVNMSIFTKEAFEEKKYAFVSDYVRLHALYNYGGIYLDSDIKVLKSFNDLLSNNAFSGFESKDRIGVWLIASEKNNPLIKEMLDCYNNKHFRKLDGTLDLEPNTALLKPIFLKHGILFNNELQKKKEITIYPTDYFCPMDGTTGKISITENSYAMHLFNGSWLSQKDKERNKLYKKYYIKYTNKYSYKIGIFVAKILTTYEFDGLKALFIKSIKKVFK